jgi:hypothetical protein
VDDGDEPAEAHVLEAVGDDVEGGALVRDQQHALAAGEVVADDVRDRLALAGAGRAVNDQAARFAREADGAGLAGVGLGDEALLGEVAGLALQRLGLGLFGDGARRGGEQAVALDLARDHD